MSELLKDSLYTVLECYKQGFERSILITPAASGEGFDRDLQAIVDTRVPLKEQLLMYRCSEARKQGLLAARRGYFATANQMFEEASVLFHSAEFSPESCLIHKTFQGAAEAYLDYRR